MNKVLAMGLVALALLLTAQQQASAWSKYNFGVGLNVGWEGGGNSVLWGVLNGGPSPGQADGGFSGGYPGDSGMIPNFPAPMAPPPPPPPPPPPAKPMPTGNPGVAQPVGYFPYADPAVGYYPAYSGYPGYSYPMYYYYPTYRR
jgi:hypothetical protein